MHEDHLQSILDAELASFRTTMTAVWGQDNDELTECVSLLQRSLEKSMLEMERAAHKGTRAQIFFHAHSYMGTALCAGLNESGRLAKMIVTACSGGPNWDDLKNAVRHLREHMNAVSAALKLSMERSPGMFVEK